MSEPSVLARSVFEEIQARARAAKVQVGTELLPRLEEVSSLSAEASVLRLAGTPDPALEAVLQARFQLLAAAGGLELADVVRDGARSALTSAIHLAFRYAIGLAGA